jgi:hypothetical protein
VIGPARAKDRNEMEENGASDEKYRLAVDRHNPNGNGGEELGAGVIRKADRKPSS